MPDDKLLDVAEPCHGEIGSQRCLHAFFSDDSEANVSFLDHGDVVSTITDASNDFACDFFDVDSNDSFLSRAASTDTDGFRSLCNVKELLAQLLVCYDHSQCGSIDHQHMS